MAQNEKTQVEYKEIDEYSTIALYARTAEKVNECNILNSKATVIKKEDIARLFTHRQALRSFFSGFGDPRTAEVKFTIYNDKNEALRECSVNLVDIKLPEEINNLWDVKIFEGEGEDVTELKSTRIQRSLKYKTKRVKVDGKEKTVYIENKDGGRISESVTGQHSLDIAQAVRSAFVVLFPSIKPEGGGGGGGLTKSQIAIRLEALNATMNMAIKNENWEAVAETQALVSELTEELAKFK